MADVAANTGLLTVRLVSPDRLLLDTTAASVELPSSAGYLETLYGAAPLLSELGAGEVRLHGGSSHNEVYFVAGGFVEVLPERVTILAETALDPKEIDTDEARQELALGTKMWQEAGDNAAKYEEANTVTRRAEEKIASAKDATA
ncbi:MAG: ATP synthase F1 subunit epsilon [Acidobacteriaceae bacterium]